MMSTRNGSARGSARSVVIVGLLNKQFSRLRSWCRAQGISIRLVSHNKLLKLPAINADLVVLTRFVGHKHSIRAKRIAAAPVHVAPTRGIDAIRRMISEFFGD